jgi:hypothetical protein
MRGCSAQEGRVEEISSEAGSWQWNAAARAHPCKHGLGLAGELASGARIITPAVSSRCRRA